jgi:hypothetical protein
MPGLVDADGGGDVGSAGGRDTGGTGLVTGRDGAGGAGSGSDVVAGGGCDSVGAAGSGGDATGGGAPCCGPAAAVSAEPEPAGTDGDEV